MTISNEQWKEIERKLQLIYGHVTFEYEGVTVDCQRRLISENQMHIVVYIDGKISGSMCLEREGGGFDPLAVKFWRRRSRYIYTRKRRQQLHEANRQMKKLKIDALYPDPDCVLVQYDPSFTTARSLVQQFRKVDGLQLKEGDG